MLCLAKEGGEMADSTDEQPNGRGVEKRRPNASLEKTTLSQEAVSKTVLDRRAPQGHHCAYVSFTEDA